MPDMSKKGANVRYQVDDFKARAQLARRDAERLVTRAEIWEDAARRLEDAIDKDERQHPAVTGDSSG